MPPRRPTLLLLLIAGIALLGAALPTSARSPKRQRPVALLPDLAQDVPAKVSVLQVNGAAGPEFRLGFQSAVRNIGRGPLIIRGRRSNASEAMRAEQIVKLSDGRKRRFTGVIPMRYAYAETHNHFHVLRFDRYSLRDPRTGRKVRPDQKTGFCLGDRDETGQPRRHPRALYGPRTGECARGKPEALKVLEGLTPGYRDDYGPQLEGQYIDITGVPAGRYSLVHQVNADRRIRERNFKNDVASALIAVDWPKGPAQPPTVRVLERCKGRAHCKPPRRARSAALGATVPTLTAAEAARFRLWCSLLEPVGQLSSSARRDRARRIEASDDAWRTAAARAAERSATQLEIDAGAPQPIS